MTRPTLSAVLAVAAVATLAAQNPVGPPADEAALNKAAAVKDPGERVDALVAVVRDYPRAVYIRNVAYYLNRTIRGLPPEQARPLLERFVTGTAPATAYARSEFDASIARDLLSTSALLDRAVELSEQGVALANESDYVDNERRTHEQKQAYFAAKDPAYHPEPFSLAEATERFRAFNAVSHATLGRLYVAVGRLADADRTLAKAYAIKPTVEAATGLADVAEKRGDTAGAIARLEEALLTGRMLAPGIARLHAMYAAAHAGRADGRELEAELDAKYRAAFRNPVMRDRVAPPAARAADPNRRVVLAEFVTGAGCDPCVSVDLAFDAVLDRYTRNDVVLLVYPMHAPTSDPMSNASAQARHKYYAANSAPTVFLDGRTFETGEGLATEAVRVAKTLDQGLASRLTEPAGAKLTLTAARAGSTSPIDVTASVNALAPASSTLRLHVALVEEEVSYSGENGLRFHPMVVRNLARVAGPATDGFALDANGASKVTHVFDLDRIVAENLRYYDDYRTDLKQRTGIDATFKEQRHLINPAHLAVVAFVQDDASKAVLQSAYVKVGAK